MKPIDMTTELGSDWTLACTLAAFGKRSIVPVQIGERSIIVIKDRDENFYAANRACPHQAADLAKGRCQDGKLVCPRHLAWFDLQDGKAKGWFVDPLRLYDVRVSAGSIFIRNHHQSPP